MPRFALTISDQFVRLENRPSKPADIPHKNVKWLPCDAVAPPAFDATTEKVVGPTYTVGALSVTEAYQKVALTAEEIAAGKAAAVSSINGPWSAILKLFYATDKRLRVLEGKPAISFATFKNGVVGDI